MDKFIPISEAAKLTGKTEKTIRRLIKSVAQQMDSHRVDSKDYPIKTKQKGKIFIYLISQSYLEKKFGLEKVSQWGDTSIDIEREKEFLGVDSKNDDIKGSSLEKENNNVYPQDDFIGSLQDHISTLKNQLQEKDQHIKELTERTREANVMLNNLQNKLFLLEQPKAEEPKNDQTAPAKKQSLFSRLFRTKQS